MTAILWVTSVDYLVSKLSKYNLGTGYHTEGFLSIWCCLTVSYGNWTRSGVDFMNRYLSFCEMLVLFSNLCFEMGAYQIYLMVTFLLPHPSVFHSVSKSIHWYLERGNLSIVASYPRTQHSDLVGSWSWTFPLEWCKKCNIHKRVKIEPQQTSPKKLKMKLTPEVCVIHSIFIVTNS